MKFVYFAKEKKEKSGRRRKKSRTTPPVFCHLARHHWEALGALLQTPLWKAVFYGQRSQYAPPERRWLLPLIDMTCALHTQQCLYIYIYQKTQLLLTLLDNYKKR